jgi:UDP-MurNAc hydroxylase
MFKPKVTIPIASFVWFCHEENVYLNDEVNRPQKVVDFISNQTNSEPVMMYPGDTYVPLKPYNNSESIAKYNVDFEQISNPQNLIKSDSVEHAELLKQAEKFVNELSQKFGVWTKILQPTNIFIIDYNKAFQLSMKSGLTELSKAQNECDCSLSSESLAFNFKFPWGNDTLGINGRYQRPKGGNYSRFYNFFRYNQLESRGIPIDITYFTGMLSRKVLVKLGMKKI